MITARLAWDVKCLVVDYVAIVPPVVLIYLLLIRSPANFVIYPINILALIV